MMSLIEAMGGERDNTPDVIEVWDTDTTIRAWADTCLAECRAVDGGYEAALARAASEEEADFWRENIRALRSASRGLQAARENIAPGAHRMSLLQFKELFNFFGPSVKTAAHLAAHWRDEHEHDHRRPQISREEIDALSDKKAS